MKQKSVGWITTEETITPVAMVAAKKYLDRIGFVEQINTSVAWDKKQCKVSPGQLASAVILTTFMLVRFPLYKVETAFQQMDLEFLLGKDICEEDLNDDAIGRALDKIYAVGCSTLFFQIAMKAYIVFDISLKGGFHVDTSSIALFGEYEVCEEKDYDGLDVTHGYSKDHRPDLKQVMVGDIVNRQGIPLYHKTLDGNTADCLFNQETIRSLAQLLGDKLKDFIYIADAKLITLPNLALLSPKDHKISFVSRCPDSFYHKLAAKVKKQAYQENQWQDIGSIKEDKHHVSYQVQSFNERIISKKDKLDEEYRLIVVKNSLGRDKVSRRLKKDKQELEKAIEEIGKKTFACEPDAKKAADDFLNSYRRSLLDVGLELRTFTIEKRKRGNPGKNPTPVEKVTFWQIRAFIKGENQERMTVLQQQEESFVLITNISADDVTDADALWNYKGQHVVEVQFHLLKQPSLAANVWLKKPERIEALAMLLHVSLLIRALMQLQARERVAELDEIPRIDFNRGKLERPTAEKIISLFHGHTLIRRGDQYYHSRCSDREYEKLMILFDLLRLNPNQLFD